MMLLQKVANKLKHSYNRNDFIQLCIHTNRIKLGWGGGGGLLPPPPPPPCLRPMGQFPRIRTRDLAHIAKAIISKR